MLIKLVTLLRQVSPEEAHEIVVVVVVMYVVAVAIVIDEETK